MSLQQSKTAVITQPDPVSQDLNCNFVSEACKDNDDTTVSASDFKSDSDSNDNLTFKQLKAKSKGKTLEGAKKRFDENAKKQKLKALAEKAKKKKEDEENCSDKANKISPIPP